MKLPYKNISEKLELLKCGSLNLMVNIKSFLESIQQNQAINCFNSIFEDDIIDQADNIQNKILQGSSGKLAGCIIAVKDNIAIADKTLTCSSNTLKKFKQVYNSTVVEKLLKEDALIIGKTNLDEFAMGSSNENSAFGAVKNPIDEDRVPGGSSGGSAAAVAASLCDASIGSDTGGSIRQPAAYCGIYGLKPTYGAVSRYGLTSFASSFDCVGPLANSIEDIELLFDVISGYDENDSTSIKKPELMPQKNELSIGVPYNFFEKLDEQTKHIYLSFIDRLKANGFRIVDLKLSTLDYAISTYYILTNAEASSNLARYDGVRYSTRSNKSSNLDELFTNSRSEFFGKEVKRRIMLGTYILSAGYYDAYYKKAQQVRRLIQDDYLKQFEICDIILTPTTPTPAFRIGENITNPIHMYLNDIFTTSANLVGMPALSMPLKQNMEGLPLGIHISANLLREADIFTLAKQINTI